MEWDPQTVLLNIRKADTDDLIDRVTVYRAGMEPEAIALIEDELHRRGVKEGEIDAYLQKCRLECLFQPDGIAKMCSFCRKPAVRQAWGWHRLLGKVPVLPRYLRYCKEHGAK